jgi:5'-nucleotidase
MCSEIKVSLFVVNDFLSKLEPFIPFIPGEYSPTPVGGIGRIGQALHDARQASPGQVLSFIAGLDLCGPVADLYEGEAEIACLEAAGFSGVIPGIHEFEYGPEWAGSMFRKASIPLISSNLEARHSDLSKLFVQSMVYETVNAKVGVFGLSMVAPTSIMKSGPSLESGDYILCARRAVEFLREQGADVIVGVTHIGIDADIQVAAEISGIHAIFGAHSHSLTPDPKVIESQDGFQTLVMQAGTGGSLLGRLDLVVEKGAINDDKTQWSLIPMDENVPTLKEVHEVAAPYIEGVDEYLGSEVTVLPSPLDGSPSSMRSGVSPLGNLVADAFRWYAKADIGMVSTSLIQSDGTLPSGPIRYEQLYEVLPFSNSVFVYQVTGEELLSVLRTSGQALLAEPQRRPSPMSLTPRSFLQLSGLQIEFYADDGGVKSVMIDKGDRVEPVDEKASYSVAGPSWFCHGGDGYGVLASVPSWNTGGHDFDVVASFLKIMPDEGTIGKQRIYVV